MSAKLFLFTVFSLSLMLVLVLHWRAGARRWVIGMLLATVLAWGAAPWVYPLAPKGWIARPTITWPQVAMLFMLVVLFTPAKGRKLSDIGDPDFDTALPTDAAPLGKN